MADIYSLLMGEEPTAAEQAAAMAQALRSQRGAGGLALLTGDRVLGNFGQALLNQAQQGEGMLAQAGQARAGNVLKMALEAKGNAAAIAKAKADAERRDAERADEREYQKERDALNRSNAKEVAAITAGDKAAQQQLETEGNLRKELTGNAVVKEYQNTAIALDKLRGALEQGTAAGDMAGIFSFMKSMDPTSAVKETEFANAQNATGWPERVRNMYNQAKSGERLSPEQRAEFLGTAFTQFSAVRNRAEPIISGFEGLAQQAGVAPQRVVLPGTRVSPDFAKPVAPSATPAAPVITTPDGKRWKANGDGTYSPEE